MVQSTNRRRRPLGYALVAGLMFVTSPVHAGLMTLIISAATPLNFTSEWEWLFDNGTWATIPNTVQLGAPDWEVTMQGFAGGDLSETSRHLVAPHPGEIAPNILSSFDYPGTSGGLGPTISWIGHPAGDFDVYTLTAIENIPGSYVQIFFNGEHTDTPDGTPRAPAVPEPSSFLLLGAGLAALLAVRGSASLRRKAHGRA
jgi:PEP-CTERM motif